MVSAPTRRTRAACVTSLLCQASIAQTQDLVVWLNERRIVGHDNNRRLLLIAQIAEQSINIGSGLTVEFTSRLIGQDQLRPFEQRPRNGYALLFTAGELIRSMIESPAKSDDFQQFHRAIAKSLKLHWARTEPGRCRRR